MVKTETAVAVVDDPGGEYIERRLQAIGAAGAAFNPQIAAEAIQEALQALREQVRWLRSVNYNQEFGEVCPVCRRGGSTPKDIATAAACTSKVIDQITRLSEFAQGRADSRPDLGVFSLLEFLSDEQFRQVEEWMDAGRRRGEQ